MKKHSTIFTIAAMLLFLSGCSATTITEHEGNYLYGAGESINVIDIDTREHIGTLKVTEAVLLSDTPFTVTEKSGTDENGNDIYETVTYAQLVQIFYQYDDKENGKDISAANFTAYDAYGQRGEINPAGYTGENRNGSDSFLVALENKSGTIRLDFQYNVLQTTATAKIQLSLSQAGADSTAQSAPPEMGEPLTAPETDSETSGAPTERETSGATTEPETSEAMESAGTEAENGSAQVAILYVIIGVLAAAVVILLILLIRRF